MLLIKVSCILLFKAVTLSTGFFGATINDAFNLLYFMSVNSLLYRFLKIVPYLSDFELFVSFFIFANLDLTSAINCSFCKAFASTILSYAPFTSSFIFGLLPIIFSKFVNFSCSVEMIVNEPPLKSIAFKSSPFMPRSEPKNLNGAVTMPVIMCPTAPQTTPP